mmetsp:Transcript_38090/g.61681  ORF Transcript_38090/g.61681 Transcript_38090/m.61681 type:complete len:106 (-) Transcript_38090:955-1272(-)|eukprot:CAMPEP_0184649408 /NCGR_PEP_ID=MMETSP0308-20130426/6770_1 /TAXON_ID=38269 /ORGANISM="Gloeochaete witrockiana, Strain SAG 46.84" /LENGTH=105 /DNA_ID=CAMNT_0027082101 /DNA_START=11 /DNA_END=328 /DNA_ORIENTATION=-
MARIKRRRPVTQIPEGAALDTNRCEIETLPLTPKYKTLTDPLRAVQDLLDRDVFLIQQLNASQQALSSLPDDAQSAEIETNARLLRELNGNINQIVRIYTELHSQ